MELKDWGYLIGFILTFGVSLFALMVNIKNRKNAIREHLYKEQFNCFMQLSKNLAILSALFDDVILEKELTDEMDKKVEGQIKEIEGQIDFYYFIMPDELFPYLHKLEEEIGNLHIHLINPKKPITNNDGDKFYHTYTELLEQIREFVGVDNLSDENKKLIGKTISV